MEPVTKKDVRRVAVKVLVGEGVAEGDVPALNEAVGEADTVPLGVPLPVEVGVTVPVLEGESVADTLGLRVELGVVEGEAPQESV